MEFHCSEITDVSTQRVPESPFRQKSSHARNASASSVGSQRLPTSELDMGLLLPAHLTSPSPVRRDVFMKMAKPSLWVQKRADENPGLLSCPSFDTNYSTKSSREEALGHRARQSMRRGAIVGGPVVCWEIIV